MCRAHQVCEGVWIVEAGVARGRNDVIQFVGWEAEVWHILKAAVRMLDVHPVVLCTSALQDNFTVA